jgi:hypothetical protein
LIASNFPGGLRGRRGIEGVEGAYSAANPLPLIGSSRGEVAREFYTKCLALPHAPAWSPLLQIWQTLWSAVLLFLFLLALRNQFKIK